MAEFTRLVDVQLSRYAQGGITAAQSVVEIRMGISGRDTRRHAGDRRCAACGAMLAADNTARLCGKCHRDNHDQLRTPPSQLKDEFFETDEFREAFESQHIGKVFRAYRNHPRHLQVFGRALNQEQLGRWLGLTQAQVSKLENGKPEQNLDTLRQYASTLHLPRGMLWFKFPGESLGSPALGAISAYGGLALFANPSNDRIATDDQQTTKVVSEFIRLTAIESTKFGLGHDVSELHPANIEQIEETVRRLSVDFVANDPIDTFVRSRELRNEIFALLEKRTIPRQEQALYSFAARVCGYLAAASSDFFGHYDAAADQCRVARRFSDVAGTPELQAWALSLHSGVSFWQGNWKQAATLAEHASELAVTRSGALRAASMHARALARLGDTESLRSVINASVERLADSRSEEENGMILFSETNHLRNVGTANLWAGRTGEARDQLARALRDYLTDSPENIAVIATIRADLALSFLKLRDIDGASEALSTLLEIQPDRRLEGVIRRLRDLRSLLHQREYANSTTANSLVVRIDDFLLNSRQISIDDLN